jgi:hypothetical protein
MAMMTATALTAADDPNDYKRNLASFGAWGGPVPLDVQSQTGLVPGEGIMVRWVRPGGPAAQMGIEPGDVILKLNDSTIASRADLRGVVVSNNPGAAAQAVVMKPSGDVAVLDGNFGERRTNRPLRPLSDDWERAVAERQREELLARADALARMESALDEIDPHGGDDAATRGADGDEAGAATDAAGGAAGGDGPAAASGPWRLAFAWVSPASESPVAPAEAAPTAAVSSAPAWRVRVHVPADPTP